MGFIYPQMLWLLLVLVPLVAAWNFVSRAHERTLARFVVRENWALLNSTVSGRARFHKALLILLAVVFSVVAAARPWWGTREREVFQRGVNIIFAVDVSKSMMATDVSVTVTNPRQLPTRLESARTLVRQILAETKGDRVGLMPFAGEAFLQTPLTTDHGIVQDAVRQLDFDSIGLQGTDIGAVVKEAAGAFERSGEGTRVLVIVTDGESHGEKEIEAARLAADKGIRIYALGIGSKEGAPIRLPDGAFKEDAEGHKVLTALNPQLLADLASATGGKAWTSGITGQIDPSPIIEELSMLEKADFGQEKRVVREEQYQWPLALALLCLALDSLLHDRRRSPRGRTKEAVA